jgi:hypothetical protein
MVLQARWRGMRLRRRLRAALMAARFDDDELDEFEAVDDSWLQAAAAGISDLDDEWRPSMPSSLPPSMPLPPIGAVARGGRPAPLTNLHASLPGVSPGYPASTGGGGGGGGGGRGSGGVAPWAMTQAAQDVAARHAECTDPASSCASSPTSDRSGGRGGGGGGGGGRSYESKMQAVAVEWGLSDPRLAATLVKRQERQKKMQREHEKRQTKADPIKRLESLQRKQQQPTYPPPQQQPPQQPPQQSQQQQQQSQQSQQSQQQQQQQSQQSQQLIIRHAPQPPNSSGGLYYLSEGAAGAARPTAEAWDVAHAGRASSAATGHGGNGGGGGGGGGPDRGAEVVEELELASVSDVELRASTLSFQSDVPNAKLARSASGRRSAHEGGGVGAGPKGEQVPPQQQRPTLSLNTLAWATPPSSSGGDGKTMLPVGSALRVARAAAAAPQAHDGGGGAASGGSAANGGSTASGGNNPFARLKAVNAPLQTVAAADPMFEPVAIPFRVSLLR